MPHPPRLIASRRFRVALVLALLSYLVGWPAAALLGAISAWLGTEWLGVIVGTTTYAFSWLLLGVAVLMGGREVLVFARSWTRYLLRRLLGR